MAIKLNDKYVSSFINASEYKNIQTEVNIAAQALRQKIGAGNTFLGWVDLPDLYDKEEFARIKIAAEKIQSSCDVLVVIGIGGSYLGARAAIEFLKSPLYNNLNKKNVNSSEKNKVINVTKPREVKSNIDTSRVSDLTLREQQALERLSKKVGASTRSKDRASNIKSIIAIILVIILIILAIVFIVLISQNKPTEEEEYDVRMSMQIENKSILSIVTDTGKEELRKISPGDVLPIKAYVRNSDNYSGDDDLTDSNINPQNVYVRFKIKVILGYDVRYRYCQ